MTTALLSTLPQQPLIDAGYAIAPNRPENPRVLRSAKRTDWQASDVLGELPPELGDTIAFLHFLHDDHKGYFCINAGVADDTAITGIRMLLPDADHPDVESSRRWFYYDPARPDILLSAARYVQTLEAEHGNVYTTRTLFRSKSAKASYASASPIVFIDDAPRETPLAYHLYVATGTGNGQAYYKLSTNAKKQDTRHLTKALGGDPTGIAENKLLRIPGTRNTKAKHGGNYAVAIELELSGTYTPDQIRACFPTAEGDTDQPERTRAAKPWEADKEQRLAVVYRSVKRLLTPDGHPRVIKNVVYTNQGWRIFCDPSHYSSYKHPSGSWDASNVRWIRTKSLIIRGVTDEQAAAIVYACEDSKTIHQKGSIAVWNDIKACVDEWRARYPQVAISNYSQWLQHDMLRTSDNTAPAVEIPRPKIGRPRTAPNLEHILATYHTHARNGRLHQSRRERAALLQCSTATLDRCENILRTRGDILIYTSADRRSSWVELMSQCGVIKTIEDACTSTPEAQIGVIKIPDCTALVITPVVQVVDRIATPQNEVPSCAHACVVTHVVPADTPISIPEQQQICVPPIGEPTQAIGIIPVADEQLFRKQQAIEAAGVIPEPIGSVLETTLALDLDEPIPAETLGQQRLRLMEMLDWPSGTFTMEELCQRAAARASPRGGNVATQVQGRAI